MLRNKKAKNKHNKIAMAERADKRRDDWVEFHADEVWENEAHEKKLRYNYFADSTLTNPALHDFRPNSVEDKGRR
jgi:hypothetical protein